MRDLISSFGFKPLILQPTRVTSATPTVINNIFDNNIEYKSIGGDITTGITDHFPHFLFYLSIKTLQITDCATMAA